MLVFALIGIAWGVMPVDPSRFRWGRRGRIVVSGAGPAMNVALAFLTLTLLIAWLALGPQGGDAHANIAVFLWTGGWLNLVLALLNLLPVPPLDGSDILSGFSFKIWQLYQHPRAPMAGLILLLLVFYTGCGGVLFGICHLGAALFVDTFGMLLNSPSIFDVIYA
jgi:Zn-dependent protease